MHYIEESLLEGIRLHDSDTLEYIYKKFFPSVSAFVNSNSGSDDDARDVFQEAIVAIYRRVSDDNFAITCSFKTYVYAIVKNLWLKELEKRKASGVKLNVEGEFEVADEQPIEGSFFDPKSERFKLYQKHFLTLSEDCQKVLRLFFAKQSLIEISQTMGYGSEKYAKKRKFQCKEILVKRIKNDPEFNKIRQ
ncbi:MAG: sigma-70 family RNA polymerase sigma factor [Bacteroidales bacterium]|jgi:RNA polymerase sigma factor (sigma-70 family)|nr:sigma-70 family RNA polymerase sigma factor [Bacteroidales bacterium]